MKSTGLTLAALFALTLAPVLHAQSPAPSITNANLRSQVSALQQEILGLQRDYQMLLTTCQNTPPAPSSPAALNGDAAMADRLERAASRLQQVQLDADNRLAQQRQQQLIDDDLWVVKSADFGVTESNRVFVRYAWNVTIKNGLDRTQAFDVAVQFLDKDDLVIDTARVYGHTIAAYDETTINGDKLVSMPGALRVAKVTAVATRKSR
ncbi:MAG TPA: hypothetical protein VG222_11135 [Vicinamibacterales bacterium]|jgi:hypothetical protein|nr:hypothetical protein [Vicinamibacterales bacterium]